MHPEKALSKQRGVTLIELMIVIVILAVIASFAYPSYMNYVVDAKRTAATSILLQVADRQQQFFMDNKRFANDLTNLGFANNPLVVADDGRTMAGAGNSESTYSVALTNVTATTYTITAAPLNGQAARDTECGSLTLNQTLTKGSDGGSDCWK
ncbi:MAG: prepilin-type N-terminal cleavage/methylation domain-containing protein [Gammaproteobacteria bacterium]|jgi:type IV pilus assembly protein PilE|nr:prepilin-type N-terminal cleavage/methylation domain-containing protein [Gammaproteobacteria bacterium]MDH3758084.1 prepilin-type N-terminal cleavage/methylation domain-containing protein [Gammaproteobacteria bacterium]MDH3848883.1 prepilin-type N-terminal cleavage/methylation domain-containing protein [Gammaproteobacteria bacterium]MDH3864773.1 prepilin-type N-terminal cleavage/methylation domain-containing protein [Gammaproteobacteria bacterium]MDH3906808.1 prepilin-type N-terminal cleavag